ncbi:UNVERIFIED_CONTAM: hypothetical protein Slati_3931600 [Sesamum latifolium]|uniref:Reverse transcriptase zinc-binding domain-containing protein n=1 Tax=Sesamum latifolium TaxID=2727402 RepID=A0AAW2TPC4_9LAMI
MFTWRACRDSLPTSTNLARRGVNIQGACPWCSLEGKDLLHSLLRCHFARLVWALSSIPCAILVYDHSSPELWFRGLARSLDGPDFSHVLLCCWFLWGARNRKLFENSSLSAPAIMDFVRSWEMALLQNDARLQSSDFPTKTRHGFPFNSVGIG